MVEFGSITFDVNPLWVKNIKYWVFIGSFKPVEFEQFKTDFTLKLHVFRQFSSEVGFFYFFKFWEKAKRRNRFWVPECNLRFCGAADFGFLFLGKEGEEKGIAGWVDVF